MRLLIVGLVAGIFQAQAAAAEFALTFNWGDIPLCTTGSPNKVGNPKFVLKDVPAGTTSIKFQLKDLDVPNYNHGGGKIDISTSGAVPSGAFTYKSPCPPNAVHTYEWTATARNGNKVLATAKARRKYPE